uniref:V-SNARE coiled-coil homology domain-containing protein n=1 Tax=Entomoneis paludosa TaxID=265537 RepID=A0A7S2Y9D4_9STRA
MSSATNPFDDPAESVISDLVPPTESPIPELQSSDSSLSDLASLEAMAIPEPSPEIQPVAHKIVYACIVRDGEILVESSEKPEDHWKKAIDKTANEVRKKNEEKATVGFSTYEYKAPKFGRRLRHVPSFVGMKLTVPEYGSPDDLEDDEDIDFESMKRLLEKRKLLKADVNTENTKESVENMMVGKTWDAHGKRTVWTFCCVFNPEATSWKHPYDHMQTDIESFLKELDRISSSMRNSPLSPWRAFGWESTLVQKDFGPILADAMRDVGYIGRRDRVNKSVMEAKKTMNENITHIVDENMVQAEKLQSTAEELLDQAKVFEKKSRDLKKNRRWKDQKTALILGGTVAAVGGAVFTPLLLAFL